VHQGEVKGEVIEVLPEHDIKRRQLADDLNGQGFRVVALAYKQMPGARMSRCTRSRTSRT